MNATIKNSSFNENDALLKISILRHTIKIKMNQLHLMNFFFQQPSKSVLRKRCSENMHQIYWRTPLPTCDFNKVAKQVYRNHTFLAWVFFCKFAAYFQNTFSKEHFSIIASVLFKFKILQAIDYIREKRKPPDPRYECRLRAPGKT